MLPTLITLGVTVLRLGGELQHGSRAWFNPEPGGFLGVVGIVRLVPILGVYLALKLSAPAQGPERVEQALGMRYWAPSCVALGFYLFSNGIIRGFPCTYSAVQPGEPKLLMYILLGFIPQLVWWAAVSPARQTPT